MFKRNQVEEAIGLVIKEGGRAGLKKHIAFGPVLALGAIIAYFTG